MREWREGMSGDEGGREGGRKGGTIKVSYNIHFGQEKISLVLILKFPTKGTVVIHPLFFVLKMIP